MQCGYGALSTEVHETSRSRVVHRSYVRSYVKRKGRKDSGYDQTGNDLMSHLVSGTRQEWDRVVDKLVFGYRQRPLTNGLPYFNYYTL